MRKGILCIASMLAACVVVGAENDQVTSVRAEAPVKAPYGPKLDRAAANEWWLIAKQAREGKIGGRRHPAGSKTMTGRHFLDLEVPRNETVAFALYTVQNRVLKMSAQLYPLFPDETRDVRLEVKKDGKWSEIATTKVNDLGWSALFRLENWDTTRDFPYRVRHGDEAVFEGLIRKNPVDKNEIVVASLSCNSSRDRGPRDSHVRNLKALDPDLLFFAGDQHYDHTEHTAGWLMFGTQFREVLKDRPVVTIPDDHDIGQHNLWGAGGAVASSQAGPKGGYFYHPEYVKQVERCQTAHLPDPFDPTPIKQGMTVYYTSLNVGGVDFAILEDRKFKSGPASMLPEKTGRPDHYKTPDFDPAEADVKGAVLLGERQLKFLNDWTGQWKGVQMKAVLSQTPFCGAAHLHGGGDPVKNRLTADLDSNAWPQTGRKKALSAIRKGFAVHLAGDQHLATLIQHGIDEFNDGPWSFVSPAIHNTVYSRHWHPADEKAGANRDSGSVLPWTGEYRDGLHNRLTMHAYANPNISKDDGAGFNAVHFDKTARTITSHCWPRFTDLSADGAKEFPGWPKTVSQISNYNPASWSTLGTVTFDKDSPVVQVLNAESAEVLYTLRVNGRSFSPHVPETGRWSVRAGADAPDKTVVKEAEAGGNGKWSVTL